MINKFFTYLTLLLILGWVGSCSLGIYKDQTNLINLGGFLFFVSMFFASACANKDD